MCIRDRGNVDLIFAAPLLVLSAFRRVLQQQTARKADGQRYGPQRPERAPDALHRPEAPQRLSLIHILTSLAP